MEYFTFDHDKERGWLKSFIQIGFAFGIMFTNVISYSVTLILTFVTAVLIATFTSLELSALLLIGSFFGVCFIWILVFRLFLSWGRKQHDKITT